MEHPGVKRLPVGDDNIAILTPSMCRRFHEDVKKLIDDLGNLSSKLQGLKHVITTFQSFFNGDNKLYILVSEDKNKALGFVKTGPRHLYFWNSSGTQSEFNILCLLDFCVCPNSQRKGYGKALIDKMLQVEGKEMYQIPIDKPSPLCLSFMKKHFNLVRFVPQSNNYVVFDQFWQSTAEQNAAKQEQYPGKYGLFTLERKSRTPRLYTPSSLAQQVQNNALHYRQMQLQKQQLQQQKKKEQEEQEKEIYRKNQNEIRTPRTYATSTLNQKTPKGNLPQLHRRLNPITWLPY